MVGSIRHSAVSLIISRLPAGSGNHWFENEVCQGRLHERGYDSGPDLCHWMLWELGCRDSRIVLRLCPKLNMKPAEDPVSRMLIGAKRLLAWRPFRLGMKPKPGDILSSGVKAYGERERLGILLSSEGAEWVIAVAGIKDQSGSQCAEMVIVPMSEKTLHWHDGPTRLNGWVDIERIVH